MLLNRLNLSALLAAMLLVTASANAAPVVATPNSQLAQEAVTIPFEPPIGESMRYRTERIDQDDKRTKMNWSVADYRFEETEDGYRLFVEPVSAGSNEEDPATKEFEKKLNELINFPFVLRINEDAEIIEVERGDELWAKMLEALPVGLAKLEPKRPGHEKMVQTLVQMFKDMPADIRLSKMTETIQPLVEFGWTAPTIGEPILTSAETETIVGPVKQDISVTLTKVAEGLAHLTVRTEVSTEEMKKMVAAFFNKFNNGSLPPEQIAKFKGEMEAAKDIHTQSVAEYKIWLEDGMLESYLATQTITATEKGERVRRVKTISVKRVD